MKKLVIIGANDFQRPLIQRAKDMGYQTHVFAWREGATGAADADFFYEISITEKEKILEICREIEPDGVATIGSDLANITVQYLAERLGLPGNSRECVYNSTNKYAMRRAFAAAGIPVPFFREAAEGETADPPAYPVIVKPTDRSGSRAITKVNTRQELAPAIQRAIDASFEKKAIVEGCLCGEEYSLEAVSYQGTHTCLAITKKYTTGSPHFIETGHLEPAPLSWELQERAKTMIFAALDALQVKNGASHSEFRIDGNGDVHIIEIGSRMGGDCIGSHLVPLSTGQDFVGMVVDIAVGNPPRFAPHPTQKFSAIRFIMGEEDLALYHQIKETRPEILRSFVLESIPGSHVICDSGSRYGYFIVQTDTREEMEGIVASD